MMVNIDYKFNKLLTLSLNFSSIAIFHSLTTLKSAILNAFFFYVNFICAFDKTFHSSKLFFNLLAIVAQGSLIVIVKSSTWSLAFQLLYM
jgi:hypothetical protein